MGGAETEGDDSATGDPAAARSPWLPALAVVGALALAHVGLGLLLTRSAREARDVVEASWTTDELEGAKAPGPPPETRGPEWARWQRTQRLWADAEVRADRRKQIGTFAWALTGSFVVLAGPVLWLAARARAGAPRS
jgi:hypothetical protein